MQQLGSLQAGQLELAEENLQLAMVELLAEERPQVEAVQLATAKAVEELALACQL